MRLSGLARAQACFPEHPGRRGLFSIFPHACSPRPGAAKLQAGEPPRQSSREVIASHLERSRDRVCPDHAADVDAGLRRPGEIGVETPVISSQGDARTAVGRGRGVVVSAVRYVVRRLSLGGLMGYA
ncbi:hypothetical protein JHW43_009386 [Diplocarpon mali]|nr:hypothetical protein JHW43_009386 [Diplocarpon mali]